ncbi:hypothetical protein MAR_025625 [Mya arenaria]|uniref:Uncharacterized protein n=1 Tax=Mya arenaria TaxID=6604 RepID=A0ABY7ENN0_MYAAR|nr:hypothetical protein MAR_025625 [Mya arenaria]
MKKPERLRLNVRKAKNSTPFSRAQAAGFKLPILICLAGLIPLGSALECYVCKAQDSNFDKCVKTTIQCRQHEDTCRSFIHWSQPRYWTPRSERIFSIDKSCTTRLECENEQQSLGLQCMRDWYRDWKCTESWSLECTTEYGPSCCGLHCDPGSCSSEGVNLPPCDSIIISHGHIVHHSL